MPRPLRYNLPDLTQILAQTGELLGPAFRDQNDYAFYRECLQAAARLHACSIHAYALAPTQVRLLVTASTPSGVHRMMQSLGRRYVCHYNQRYGRRGTVWDSRYKASPVDEGEYLIAAYAYVEGLGSTGDASPGLSSRPRNLDGIADSAVVPHRAYLDLGADDEARRRSYRRLQDVEPHAAGIGHCLEHCRVFGSEEFKDRLELLLERRVRPGRPGRPRKYSLPASLAATL